MITPEEFLANRKPDLNPHNLEQIRKHIDQSISRTKTGTAVRVTATRCDWSETEINAVLEEYRKAGWTISQGGSGYLATLSTVDIQHDASAGERGGMAIESPTQLAARMRKEHEAERAK